MTERKGREQEKMNDTTEKKAHLRRRCLSDVVQAPQQGRPRVRISAIIGKLISIPKVIDR